MKPQCSKNDSLFSQFASSFLRFFFYFFFKQFKLGWHFYGKSLIGKNICSWCSYKVWTSDVSRSGDHQLFCVPQATSLVTTGNKSTDFFFSFKVFIFTPERKIDSCAVNHDLHLHGCSSVWKEMPTIRTEYGAFQLFLNHSTGVHYQVPGCASIFECFMWKISCCATLTSSLATWWLMIPPFALQKNEASDKGRNWFETLCF